MDIDFSKYWTLVISFLDLNMSKKMAARKQNVFSAKISIEELPQVIKVLKGNMGIKCPRLHDSYAIKKFFSRS